MEEKLNQNVKITVVETENVWMETYVNVIKDSQDQIVLLKNKLNQNVHQTVTEEENVTQITLVHVTPDSQEKHVKPKKKKKKKKNQIVVMFQNHVTSSINSECVQINQLLDMSLNIVKKHVNNVDKINKKKTIIVKIWINTKEIVP